MADEAPRLTHLDERGHARMVDVGDKDVTHRRAVARATVRMQEATFARLSKGDTPKGDVLATARIAGIQAAKRTSDLIPLCHPLRLTKLEIALTLADGRVAIDATVEARDRTGVEMEALVAASTAALTIYDMLKALDRAMSFDVRLVSKTGGKSGDFHGEPATGAASDDPAPGRSVPGEPGP